MVMDHNPHIFVEVEVVVAMDPQQDPEVLVEAVQDLIPHHPLDLELLILAVVGGEIIMDPLEVKQVVVDLE
jgi:hypothetical protein